MVVVTFVTQYTLIDKNFQDMVDAKAKPFSDEKRWIVIYPTYLDSKKSLQQGRKIPKELVRLFVLLNIFRAS